MRPHFVDGVFLWFDANISQNAIFGIEQFAEALEKKHVRGQFTLVFVFDTEKHVVVVLDSLLFERFLLLLHFSWILQVILPQPHRIQYRLVLPGIQIPYTQKLSLVQCLVY